MPKAFLLLLFISTLVVSSCNKNTGDKIEHVVLTPTLMFTAFDTILYSGAVPVPTVSAITSDSSIFLDIDNNGTDDFELTLLSWIAAYNPPNQLDSFNFNGAFIKGTTQGNEIAGLEGYFGPSNIVPYQSADNISFNKLISKKLNWYYVVNLNIDFSLTNMYSENSYLYAGVKFKRDSKTAYGWIKYRKSGHHIEIAEYGYNLSNKNAIRAGQTE